MAQSVQALFDEATRCHETGRFEDAERLYRRVLNADPGHADALHQFGVLAHQGGRNDIAIDLVKHAIERAPKNAVFHNTLGGALLAENRADDAANAFQNALAIDPRSIEIRNNLANVFQAQSRWDDAISLFEEILKDAPDDPDVNNNLGHVLQVRGDFDNAIRRFRRAQKSRPDDPLILSHLGNALSAKGTYEEAVKVCEKAVALDPRSAVALTNLGNALSGFARFADAVKAYLKAIDIAGDIAEIHKNLGIAYHKLGQWNDASACFTKTLELNPNEDVHAALGETYYALGKLEACVDAFERALERSPDDHATRYALGAALNDLGRHAEGLETMAAGPGLVRLSTTPTGERMDARARRLPLSDGGEPNFVGSWSLQNPDICHDIVNFFEERSQSHLQGGTNLGINVAIKKATDLPIFPNDLKKPGFEPIQKYLRELEACLCDYAKQWPSFAEMMPVVEIVPFKIQRYRPGEHFKKPHAERVSFGLMHRVLAWMTYLNDVEGGGETEFHHYGLKIKPECGKTLIWPAEWTHTHAGCIVNSGTKYIITGWMHFPHPRVSIE